MTNVMSLTDLFVLARQNNIPYYKHKTKRELCEELNIDASKTSRTNEKRCHLTNNLETIEFTGIRSLSREVGMSVHAIRQRINGNVNKPVRYKETYYRVCLA